MNRNGCIRTIAEFAGPLGAMGSMESRDNATFDWYNTLEENDIDTLIDLLLNPPEENELGYEIPEFFESELEEALMGIGRIYKPTFFKKMEKTYKLKQIKLSIIFIIGGIRDEDGIYILEKILNEGNLTDDEIEEIITAFGRIKGEKAIECLGKMKILYPNKSTLISSYTKGS